jgi:hypothetical protein
LRSDQMATWGAINSYKNSSYFPFGKICGAKGHLLISHNIFNFAS